MPNNQRQHHTVHVQTDVLPHASCYLLCPVSAVLARIFRMDSISTSYWWAHVQVTAALVGEGEYRCLVDYVVCTGADG